MTASNDLLTLPQALRQYFKIKPVTAEGETEARRIECTVGVQTFAIGPEQLEDESHAEWFVSQICHAFQNLIAEVSQATPDTTRLSAGEISWLRQSPEAMQLLIDRYHVDETEADAIGAPELQSCIEHDQKRRKELQVVRDELLVKQGRTPGDMQLVNGYEIARAPSWNPPQLQGDKLAKWKKAFGPDPSQGVVAWLHTMHYEEGNGSDPRLSFEAEHPFGTPGVNYSAEYRITSEPLFRRSPTEELVTALTPFRNMRIRDDGFAFDESGVTLGYVRNKHIADRLNEFFFKVRQALSKKL